MSRKQKPNQPEFKEEDSLYKKYKKPTGDYMKYSGMAFQMLIILALGTYLGVKLDEYFQLETPYLAALFAILSLFIAFYITLKDLIFNKKK